MGAGESMANAPREAAAAFEGPSTRRALSLAASVTTVPIKGAMPACTRRPCAASVQAPFHQSSHENHAVSGLTPEL